MIEATLPPPEIRAFLLVISKDGRVKVDDWNALTNEQQLAVAEYVVSNYRRHDDGRNS